MRLMIVGILLAAVSSLAGAANEPCSGKRGGVVYCSGESFVCADGAISKSVMSCPAAGYPSASSSVGARSKNGAKPKKRRMRDSGPRQALD